MDSISLTLGKDLEHCWPSMKHIWTSYKTWNSLVPPQIHQAYWVSRHIPTSHLTAFFLIEILFFKSILWNIFLKGWGKIQEIPLYPLLSSRNKSLGTQLDPLYAPWLLDRAYYFPRTRDSLLQGPGNGPYVSGLCVWSQRWPCDFRGCRLATDGLDLGCDFGALYFQPWGQMKAHTAPDDLMAQWVPQSHWP